MIITRFYSKASPVIQATMDKHKGQIVSLQDLVMFCDNLEKELKIQDKLFEQCLQKHHGLTINEAKPPEQVGHMSNQDPMLPPQTYNRFQGISCRHPLSRSQMLTMERRMKQCHFIAMMPHCRSKKPEVDTMESFENTISTLSATNKNPGFFRQSTPSEIYKLFTLFDYTSIENGLPDFYTLIVISRQLSTVWCQQLTIRSRYSII
uniref:Uncharacterized protein n=1 Tax=Romanomermis culicivorax TaxID=13658 RepID=A0A915I648_ROMCU